MLSYIISSYGIIFALIGSILISSNVVEIIILSTIGITDPPKVQIYITLSYYVKWIVMAICYFDTYERRDGQWYFLKRSEKHWYSSDILQRPGEPEPRPLVWFDMEIGELLQ